MKKIEEIRVVGSSDDSPIANIGGNLGVSFLKYMGIIAWLMMSMF